MNMKSIQNYNPDFDVYFGIVSARNLDDDIVHTLMYGNSDSRDHSYEAALDGLAARLGIRRNDEGRYFVSDDNWENIFEDGTTFEEITEAILACEEGYRALEDLQVDEPIIEGTYEGTKYITSWLGGALHFFITEARAYTPWAPACSPCVPNAGNLDSWIYGATGNQSAFLPPMSWLSTEAHAAVSRSWREVCIPDGE